MGLFSLGKSKRKRAHYKSPEKPSRLHGSLPSGAKSAKGQEKVKKPGRLFAWAAGVNWPVMRIKIIAGFFCLLWICLWGRAWYLQMMEGPRLADKARRQHMASELVAGRRGMIFDRDGQVLARSVEVKSVYARPNEIVDIADTSSKIAPLLGLDKQKLINRLSSEKRKFIWLKRKIDDNTAAEVRKANLSGIGLSKEYDRFYPFKHMAGQLLGFVGMDDRGLEGIERSLDGQLGSMPVRQIIQRDAMGRKFYLHEEGQGEPVGEDVHLTLDMRIQFIAEEAIARVVKEFAGKWGGALVVDVKNGDILAWAQYPFFNPNNYRDSTAQIYRNRIAADAVEPGSTFKPFIMAAALQEKKVSPNTLINCEGGRWTTKNYTIRDTSVQNIIPASKVIRYSSNIGMAKIGQSMGAHQLYKYLHALGFGENNPTPIANSRGILRRPRDWGEVDVLAASFGQSVSVTALQMAQAYLTLLNHGLYMPLRLVIEENNVTEMPQRIFNESSVRAVLNMMRDVVEEKDGTGKRARIEGIEIAGKTGTAQKADVHAKAYGSKRLASFAGFFPAANPEYFIFVLVDEPERNQYGGVVAAPAFKEIASRIMTHTGLLNEKALVKANEHKKGRLPRGLKFASMQTLPWEQSRLATDLNMNAAQAKNSLKHPGHLARPSDRVPDVQGKSVRNAVELFARAGIVPELKGTGSKVVRQSPPAGAPWPDEEKKTNYILWLSER